MINAVTIGPEVEFYGVSTNCGDMYEISIIPEVTETKNPWKKQPMRTFCAQDVALGIKLVNKCCFFQRILRWTSHGNYQPGSNRFR